MPDPFDQSYDPAGTRLYQALVKRDAPEWVKSASSDDIYTNDELPLEAYADIAYKEFPCHTKAACWISANFLHDSSLSTDDPSRYERVKSSLLKLASLHCIDNDVKNILESPQIKVAARAADDYLIPETMSYPITNPSEIKIAAEYLDKYRNEIPYSDRRKMSANLMTKMATMVVTLDSGLVNFLDKHLGWATGSALTAVVELTKRAEWLKTECPETSKSLADAADLCRQEPAIVRLNMSKLADILDQVDREFGFTAMYDQGWQRPEEALLGITEKTASDFLAAHCRLQTGTVYSRNDLYRLNPSELCNVFGDDFVREAAPGGMMSVDKAAEMIEALPKPDAELLDRMLAVLNVKPVMKEAATGGWSWLDDNALKELSIS